MASHPAATGQLPTAFVAGPVKGGTTTLYNCLSSAFSPQRICGPSTLTWADGPCASRHFVLGHLRYASWAGSCLHPMKESPFGTWGQVPPDRAAQKLSELSSWRSYAGPAVPLRFWAGGKAACGAADTFAETMEDLCLADVPCSHAGSAGSISRSAPLECSATCDVCENHPGIDVFDLRTSALHHVPCSVPPRPCVSTVCNSAHPSAIKLINYSAAHAVHVSVIAWPNRRAFAAANISSRRVIALDGSPAVLAGGGLGGMARQLGSLTRPGGPYEQAGGRAALRFIVGLREPVSLGLSYWSIPTWNSNPRLDSPELLLTVSGPRDSVAGAAPDAQRRSRRLLQQGPGPV